MINVQIIDWEFCPIDPNLPLWFDDWEYEDFQDEIDC